MGKMGKGEPCWFTGEFLWISSFLHHRLGFQFRVGWNYSNLSMASLRQVYLIQSAWCSRCWSVLSLNNSAHLALNKVLFSISFLVSLVLIWTSIYRQVSTSANPPERDSIQLKISLQLANPFSQRNGQIPLGSSSSGLPTSSISSTYRIIGALVNTRVSADSRAQWRLHGPT